MSKVRALIQLDVYVDDDGPDLGFNHETGVVVRGVTVIGDSTKRVQGFIGEALLTELGRTRWSFDEEGKA